MERLHTWTPRTESGFLNEEFDQILAVLNDLDTDYLRLDGSNDSASLSFLFGDLALDTDLDIASFASSVSLVVGQTASGKSNLMLSRSKIQARLTGAANTLSLNPLGGLVSVGSGGLSVGGALAVTGAATVGGNTVWHAGNDGSGSTLDADLLDGLDSVDLVPSPWWSGDDFNPGGGATSATFGGLLSCVKLPNTGSPYADAIVGLPAHLRGRSITVYWAIAKDNATSGNWVLNAYQNPIQGNAESILAVGSPQSNTIAVPSGQYYIKLLTSTVTTGSSDNWLRLRLLRDAGNFSDTHTGDAFLIGVFVAE